MSSHQNAKSVPPPFEKLLNRFSSFSLAAATTLSAVFCALLTGQASPPKVKALIPPTAHGAGITNPPDIIKFSLKGLRLHMTAEEALPIMEKLAKDNGMHPDATSTVQQPCAQAKIAALKEHRVPRTDCVGEVQTGWNFRTLASGTNITLQFTEDLPASPGRMILWRISYREGGLVTEADRSAAFSAVIEKYGPPTSQGRNAFGDFGVYCGGTAPKGSCSHSSFFRVLGSSVFNDPIFTGDVFPSNLPPVGLDAYIEGDEQMLRLDLYDGTVRFRSAKEERKLIESTRTGRSSVL